jgi:hypothetical protein
MKVIYSTGDVDKDTEILANDKDFLTNKVSFEEAQKREREASRLAGTEQRDRNALTEQPRIEGQVLAVVGDSHPLADEKNVGKDVKVEELKLPEAHDNEATSEVAEKDKEESRTGRF